MMANMIEIIKAKLRLGGELKPGELSLVMNDMLSLYSEQEARIEALSEKLDALSRGGGRGSKKTNDNTKIQLDKEQ